MENARVSRFRRTGAHALAVAGDLGYRGAQRLSRRLAAHDGPSLSGDRWVEWSFCMSRLADGPGRTLDFGAQRFDQIINCSSVEHVGLGGRYGSSEASDGDLDAMAALRSVLEPGGSMILTIPIGRDRVCAPLHRIYGHERLPQLLDGLEVDEEQYWRKRDARWEQTDRADALDIEGSESFYALGLFRLRRPPRG